MAVLDFDRIIGSPTKPQERALPKNVELQRIWLAFGVERDAVYFDEGNGHSSVLRRLPCNQNQEERAAALADLERELMTSAAES